MKNLETKWYESWNSQNFSLLVKYLLKEKEVEEKEVKYILVERFGPVP